MDKLVSSKINQAPVMIMPVKATVGVGKLFKLTLEVFQQGGKLLDEVPYEKFTDITKISIKRISTTKKITLTQALGYTMFEELRKLDLPLPTNFNPEEVGIRIKGVFDILGKDIIQTPKNLEDLQYLVKGSFEYEKAMEIFKKPENQNITLEALQTAVQNYMQQRSTVNLYFLNAQEEKIAKRIKGGEVSYKSYEDYGIQYFEKYKFGKLQEKNMNFQDGTSCCKLYNPVTGKLKKTIKYDNKRLIKQKISEKKEYIPKYIENYENGKLSTVKYYHENFDNIIEKYKNERISEIMYFNGENKITQEYTKSRISKVIIVEPDGIETIKFKNFNNVIKPVRKLENENYTVAFKINVLKDYIANGGKLVEFEKGEFITYKYNDKNYKIGSWIKSFRANDVKITAKQKTILEELNVLENKIFDVDFKIEVFQDYVKNGGELAIYKNKEPITYTYKNKTYDIGKWILTIRGWGINLKPHQKTILEELGIFDAFNNIYPVSIKIKVLTDYVSNGGKIKIRENGEVLTHIMDGKEYNIGYWIRNFRKRNPKVTKKERKLLEELGIYDKITISVASKIKILTHYKENGGHFAILKNNKVLTYEYEGNEYKIGNWIHGIRKNSIKMTKQEREELTNLGVITERKNKK